MALDIQSPDPVVESGTVSETPESIDSGSLADHEAQFSPKARAEADREDEDTAIKDRPAANTGQFAPKPADAKHKAASQRATPEDVAEINRLTKELRDLEGKIGEKDPDAKAAPRIKTLQRQIRALKALAESAPVAAPPEPVAPKVPPPAPGEFSEAEPNFDDFQDTTKYPDPLAAWVKATAAYQIRKDRFEAAREQAALSSQASEQAVINAYHASQTKFIEQTPNFGTVTEAFMTRELPPVLMNAIVRDVANGPRYVYHLAQHPELADELVFLTEGKPLSDAHVAYVQRRLQSSVQAAQEPDRPRVTPPYIPPKPPNPVRTGTINTGDDLPDDDAPLSEHERAFYKRRR